MNSQYKSISDCGCNYFRNQYKNEKNRKLLHNLLVRNSTWNLLCPSENKILIVGSNLLGAIINAVNYYKDVYVIDDCIERIDLIKKVVRLESIKNLHIIYCSISFDLPLKNNSFDVVIINGILDNEPNYFFLKFLKNDNKNSKFLFSRKVEFEYIKKLIIEFDRLIKPSGVLYIGGKNRTSPQYYTGDFDGNKFYNYGLVIRNIVRDCIGRFRVENQSANNSIGLKKYEKILFKLGYLSTRLYSLRPHYCMIEEIIDTSCDIKNSFSSKNNFKKNSFFEKVKNSNFINKNYPENFCIVAKRKGNLRNVIEKIVSYLNREEGFDRWRIINKGYVVTIKGTFVAVIQDDLNKSKAMIKIGINPTSISQLAKNYKALNLIKESIRNDSAIKRIVPEPIFHSQVYNHTFFIEKFCKGVPFTEYVADIKNSIVILNKAARFVESLHFKNINKRKNNFQSQGRVIDNHIESIKHLVSTYQSDKLQNIADCIKNIILCGNLFTTLTKGDFSASNTLISGENEISAIIDWDQHNEEGFPLIDLLNIIESVSRWKSNTNIGSNLIEKYFLKNYDEIEEKIIYSYCEKLGVDEKYIFSLTVLYWIEHIAAHNPNLIINNKKWRQNNIVDVINFLNKII